jgi:hypothetical protein
LQYRPKWWVFNSARLAMRDSVTSRATKTRAKMCQCCQVTQANRIPVGGQRPNGIPVADKAMEIDLNGRYGMLNGSSA